MHLAAERVTHRLRVRGQCARGLRLEPSRAAEQDDKRKRGEPGQHGTRVYCSIVRRHRGGRPAGAGHRRRALRAGGAGAALHRRRRAGVVPVAPTQGWKLMLTAARERPGRAGTPAEARQIALRTFDDGTLRPTRVDCCGFRTVACACARCRETASSRRSPSYSEGDGAPGKIARRDRRLDRPRHRKGDLRQPTGCRKLPTIAIACGGLLVLWAVDRMWSGTATAGGAPAGGRPPDAGDPLPAAATVASAVVLFLAVGALLFSIPATREYAQAVPAPPRCWGLRSASPLGRRSPTSWPA